MAWFGQSLGTTFTGQWWGDLPATPPADAVVGGGFPGVTVRRERPLREIDRDELRRMLEAAFADAPRDAVVKAVKREHPADGPVERGIPRVDWSSLIADLDDCLKVLDRYASRIEAGKTRTQRGEKERDELRYSADSVQEMVSILREQHEHRRRARRRRALLLLLH
jgi:hypothetical protein